MEPGEVWGYRARRGDELTPVRFVRLGTGKPVRVLVRFEALEMEGREEWVPPARLKVSWEQADAFRAREARWDALRRLSPSRDTVEAQAACEVFAALVAKEIATMDWREYFMVIRDAPALSAASGVPVEAFTGDPVGFVDEEGLVVTWPVALATAKALAARNPEPLLAEVARDERTYQWEAIHGSFDRGRRSSWTVSPETIQQLDHEYYQPRRALLRAWCGAEAVARWDELAELRKEIKRVGDVAEECIAVLRAHGLVREADRLATKLGQAVDMLRADPG